MPIHDYSVHFPVISIALGVQNVPAGQTGRRCVDRWKVQFRQLEWNNNTERLRAQAT